MLRPCLAVSAFIVAAISIACSSSRSSDDDLRSDPAAASPAPDAGSSWVAPKNDDRACGKYATWTECHVCCSLAHMPGVELTWETFRVCACRKPAPRACMTECGEGAYCGDSSPMGRSSKECRRCLTAAMNDEYADCVAFYSDVCTADADCTRLMECEDQCPAPRSDEDEDDADDPIFEAAPR